MTKSGRARVQFGGFTFIENVVAMCIVVLGFSALYAMNAQCLYYVNASREAFNAAQALQDRVELLRRATWPQLTDANSVASQILAAAPSTAGLASCTELVTINSYPAGSAPAIQVSRASGVVTVVTANPAIAGSDLIRADIQLTWQQSPNARTRTMEVSTIVGGTRSETGAGPPR